MFWLEWLVVVFLFWGDMLLLWGYLLKVLLLSEYFELYGEYGRESDSFFFLGWLLVDCFLLGLRVEEDMFLEVFERVGDLRNLWEFLFCRFCLDLLVCM